MRSPCIQFSDVRRAMVSPCGCAASFLAVIAILASTVADLPRASAQEAGAAPPAAATEPPLNPFPNAVEVPDSILDGGTEWLNTSHPIDLRDLKGKIVVLDFWTYCCINCMHVLPDLKFLEEKYPNQLVVIGVHSAKFDNEKDSKAIREAIQRYEITHPVVNDSDMQIWRRFGTQAWPTLALIDPEGKYAGSQSGEGHRELFDNVIGKLVDYHRAMGTLDETPLVFASEAASAQPSPLRYPGKVTADVANQRLFITDSNHNRIVATSLSGELQSIIGTGVSGNADGAYDQAQFNRPQGTALVGNTLYVADTENHLLRAVDLEARIVTTLAGTGVQGTVQSEVQGSLRETALNSPWSIAVVGRTLFIAMAGSHQIWSHEVGTDVIGVFAGSGREDVINGELPTSAFAQPSEIVADEKGEFLYVVDSEGSAIRRVPTNGVGAVTTVAGTSELPRGQSLFAFGDADGVGKDARFQHPLGIAIAQDRLFVADSYNHKLRQIELQSGAVSTFTGTGAAGDAIEPLQLSEPGGLAIAGDTLFVADTNNHRVVSINLPSRAATILPVTGLTAPAPRRTAARSIENSIPLETQRIAAGSKLLIKVALNVPAGYKLNELAPVIYEAAAVVEQPLIPVDALDARDEVSSVTEGTAVIELPLTGQPGEATITLTVNYGYCSTDPSNALCRLASASWQIPIVVNTDGGNGEIAIAFPQKK